jgi:biotin operon repressor
LNKKKGDVMIKRHTHLLNEFSRNKSEAKLVQQLQKSRKAVETNANGTSGYTIKEGKNAGKVLKHLKKDSNKI